MRIYTCTPVNFSSKGFFSRDSGLLSSGLKMVGVESKAIMPGVQETNQEAELIRTEYKNLESNEWWISQNLDGLVLYAWGRPQYRKIAEAVRKAGIFLILNQDSAGMVSPRVGLLDWMRAKWIYSGQGHGLKACFRFMNHVILGLTYQYFLGDRLRTKHLAQGNVIACISPNAVERYVRLCRRGAGKDLAKNVRLLPHAVACTFRYKGEEKKRQIVTIGRWDDALQKRAWMMIKVFRDLLLHDQDVSVVIVGSATMDMIEWHDGLDKSLRSRVILAGQVKHDQLCDLLTSSSVFYSPSAYESFGIAAAEALCSGCSVVSASKVTLPSFEWFVSENSGTLTKDDSLSSHVDALRREIHLWQSGGRDAMQISRTWCERFHADKVADRVVSLLNNN
jgi:glycosyltransferase involved in cell wall biosynthesis